MAEFKRKFGIDISRWQGDYNFSQAIKEGVEFVIIKGGDNKTGLITDIKFEENYKKAKAHGLDVGCYWYSKALTETEAIKEAEYFYQHCLKGKQFELPVYIDVEHKEMLALGKDKLTNIIIAFCDYLESKGYFVGIYSSLSYFKTYMNDSRLQGYTHWVACWADTCDYPYSKSFGMWQFGGERNTQRSNMIAGKITDQDYMLVDFPEKIKRVGLNGYTKETIKEEPKEEIKEEADFIDRFTQKIEDAEKYKQIKELLDKIEKSMDDTNETIDELSKLLEE